MTLEDAKKLTDINSEKYIKRHMYYMRLARKIRRKVCNKIFCNYCPASKKCDMRNIRARGAYDGYVDPVPGLNFNEIDRLAKWAGIIKEKENDRT